LWITIFKNIEKTQKFTIKGNSKPHLNAGQRKKENNILVDIPKLKFSAKIFKRKKLWITTQP